MFQKKLITEKISNFEIKGVTVPPPPPVRQEGSRVKSTELSFPLLAQFSREVGPAPPARLQSTPPPPSPHQLSNNLQPRFQFSTLPV